MKLSEKQETVLLYTVVGLMLTANIYFEQWGLAFCLMLMMVFIEIRPLFTGKQVEEFNYQKMRETFNQQYQKTTVSTSSTTNAATPPKEKSATPIQSDKQNTKSQAGAVALGVAKTLAKNDRVKALGKMTLDKAADRLEEEVKDALTKEKSTDSEEDDEKQEFNK